MISRRTTIVLVGASFSISGLYILLRVIVNERRRADRDDKNTNSDSRSSNYGTTRKSKGDRKIDEYSIRPSSSTSSSSSSSSTSGGPMFDYTDSKRCEAVVTMAHNRAKRWISYQVNGASRLVGQVGGKSFDKRPILKADPDFILKPVHMDERGIREVAFYEAIQASSKRSLVETYCSLFGPTYTRRRTFDLIATVMPWKSSKQIQIENNCVPEYVMKEIKLLHRLDLFTAEYYGMVEHRTEPDDQSSVDVELRRQDAECQYGTTFSSHILARNLMIAFSKPSVMDIKMGTETYEPDAPEDKKLREMNKHKQQKDLGLRIVGMRIFDPSHEKASEDGYVDVSKMFGRSLNTRDDLKAALIQFFGGDDRLKLSKVERQSRSRAIKKVLSRLKLIRSWFHENDVFSFTASSLLLIYESDLSAAQPHAANVKMIDFGRVRRRTGGDPGYRKGLRTLMALIEEILRNEFWSEDYNYVP